MPDEPKSPPVCSPEGVSIIAYIDALRSADIKASDVARESLEKRLDNVNEFRTQLKDQASNFPTRAEVDAQIQGIENRLRAVERYVAIGVGITIALQFALHFVK
jgi:hypothetical protein